MGYVLVSAFIPSMILTILPCRVGWDGRLGARVLIDVFICMIRYITRLFLKACETYDRLEKSSEVCKRMPEKVRSRDNINITWLRSCEWDFGSHILQDPKCPLKFKPFYVRWPGSSGPELTFEG
jgi:hypothetical protein